MSDADDMLPGEFGAAARLSPKALRLYAEHGLLIPAAVDPATGYRRYHRDQIPSGRLIARLRTLNLPLARIATLVTLGPQARQAELRAWLAAQESQLRHRRGLIEALDAGSRPTTSTPTLRTRPPRKLLCRELRVHIDELEEFVADSQQRIRARLQATGLSSDGPALVHFHGFVTHDSDGPVEVAVPFTGAVEPVDDLWVRLSPAGTDACLPLAGAEARFPDILVAYEALEAWIDAHRLVSIASPVEVRPGTDGAVLDITYPVATNEGS
ncbi:MerR family DNA-binding transcriptional regulator [Micromonospora sp. KC606]|uniref:MerR family transcriptional regulator n=1 Tax=Micromonospora sp. KC606 TaxID=2530379 RepID=UPI00104A2314|nr:MerR family DNA-binding transcriptional regulator [Micromonospora sp. KC606]TDC82373.1 MerR family DNA-binding transcriptional regulator [Micromonospora sp. KC606]